MSNETSDIDPLACALDKISGSFDRFQEAHFWLHGLERYYHYSEPFRWHLNAFLRSLKEIPQLLHMELQNEAGFSDWFRKQRDQLREDPLVDFLFKQRDIMVHRRMLLPQSSCSVGVTELRGIKLGMGFSVDPRKIAM